MLSWAANRVQAFLDWMSSPPRGPLAAAKRLLLVLVFVVLMGMLPWHIDAGRARWWAPAAISLIVLVFCSAMGMGKKIGPRFWRALGGNQQFTLFGGRFHLQIPDLQKGSSHLELAWSLLRRIGFVLPALLFFVFWALIYIAAWAWDPTACSPDPAVACMGAFGGLGTNPVFGDFLYFTINMAFANPVPDILGHSKLVHTLSTVEVMSGIGLASLYAGTFFGVQAIKEM